MKDQVKEAKEPSQKDAERERLSDRGAVAGQAWAKDRCDLKTRPTEQQVRNSPGREGSWVTTMAVAQGEA